MTADHSSRGILQSMVGLSVISKPQPQGGLGPLVLSSHEKRVHKYFKCVSEFTTVLWQLTYCSSYIFLYFRIIYRWMVASKIGSEHLKFNVEDFAPY